jgi:hypothetical protein
VTYALLLLLLPQQAEPGFLPLFDGKTLAGWTIEGKSGSGYLVRDGVIVCPKDGGGNLLTQNQYENFILRFEFKLAPGGNNGVALRAPKAGNPAYDGIESQILDDAHPMYAKLEPYQYHGSLYGIVPSRRGATRPAGQWNSEEIVANGRQIIVRLNGQTIVNANLNQISDSRTLMEHPGMLRERGHLGFMGHGPEEVQLRNIRIRELPSIEAPNRPPQGFRPLFNGRDLRGWKGLVADPPAREKMTPQQLRDEQRKADQLMREHWKVENGILIYDGKGNSLCTARDYKDFEMLVDWKIKPEGDSGIYLRGSPQVQIWDDPVGSGGLYNNQNNPSKPLVRADLPPGEWNRFRILMVGDKVHVFLNGELVTRATTMENYWDRSKPIYPAGQIELQHHGNELQFRNVFVREIAPPRRAP